MARTNIFEVVIDEDGVPVTGATIYVYDARTTDEITVYSTEGGGGTLTQPLTTTAGAIPGWVPEGEYDLAYSYGAVSGTRRYNAIKGGEPALAPSQVTATEIAADAVGSSEIAAGAVTASEIADDSVASAELTNDAVATANIQDNAVTAAKIATDAVGSDEIAANAVTAAEIAADAVGSSEIAADAVTSSELADNAVDTAAIATDAVTYTKIDGQLITVGVGSQILNINATTETETCTVDAPTDGTYLIIVSAEATNNYHGGATAATLTSTVKDEGTTIASNTRDWELSVSPAPNRAAHFSHVIPRVLSANDTIKHYFTDDSSSHTDIAALAVIIYLVRIGNA